MKRIHLLLSCLFCFLFISGVCHAQRKNSPKVLQSNFIKSAHTYSFLVRDGKINHDSTLSVIRKYNKHGRSTHTKLHDSLGVAYITYEYLYKDDDTTYLGRNVFANPSYKLLYSTEVKYNKKGLLIKSTDSRPGQASKSGAIHKYNQLNQLTDITFNQNGAKSAHQTYTYDSKGKTITSVLTTANKSPIGHFLIKDNMINTYIKVGDGHSNLSFKEIYNNRGLVSEFYFYALEEINILGADDMIKLKSGDELKIVLDYYENGLIKNKTQYLNGKLNAFVTFHYDTKRVK